MKKRVMCFLLVTLMLILSCNGICLADNAFVSPAYIDPYGGYELRAEFDDCMYNVSADGVLRKYDYAAPPSEDLAYDVRNFITDNETIYYISYNENKQGIYKLDIASKNELKVLDGNASAVESCWQNKYLYYFLYDENNVDFDFSTWLLDLETGETNMLFTNSTINFQAYNGKLYYAPFAGDNTSTDLFVSELDGSDARILVNDICNFEIFDNMIYYAKCDKDWGSSKADFHMIRCNLDGVNATVISDKFQNTYIHRIAKNSFFVGKDYRLEEIKYKADNTVSGIVLNLQREPITADYHQNATLKAYKGEGLIWEFPITLDYTTELECISEPYMDNGNVYIAVGGTLYALNINTGQIRWTVDDVGASNSFAFDGYGNIYVSGYYGPNIVVINNDGKELYRDNDISYGWVYDLNIIGNVLNISYAMDNDEETDKIKTLDISQFYPYKITVIVNENEIVFDQPPIFIDGRTLVPLRAIFEALGASVEWNEETQTVTSKRNEITISLSIDSDILYVNGLPKALDVPAQLVNDRTLIPARAVSEAFNCNVEWIETEQKVIINDAEAPIGNI